MVNERWVVCAAVKNSLDGRIVCGARHWDMVMHGQIDDYTGWRDGEQGFIDQWGTFMDREDAWAIAERNGQIVRRVGGDGDELFSENLY